VERGALELQVNIRIRQPLEIPEVQQNFIHAMGHWGKMKLLGKLDTFSLSSQKLLSFFEGGKFHA
jgi:hypothetical protein